MLIRKATEKDLYAIAEIYSALHTQEEQHEVFIGWARGVYPTYDTANLALQRGDLFVQEHGGKIVGAAIINRLQVDVYEGAPWKHPAEDSEVMVLHTLVISPMATRCGFGKSFVDYYENYAREHGCPYLRIDTNAGNVRARAMYKKLGYEEIAIVPCVFNGIKGVPLVLLEKKL